MIEAMKQMVEALTNYDMLGVPEIEDAIAAGRQAIAEAEKQEPVGQLQEEFFGRGQVMWFKKPDDQTMLYTHPPKREPDYNICPTCGGMADDPIVPLEQRHIPKREWVGLTDELKIILIKNAPNWTAIQLIEETELLLKEKNT